MPVFLISWAFKALGWGRSLFAWARTLSPTTLAIITLVALAGVQTWRLGHRTDQRDKAVASMKAQSDAYAAAQKQAARIQNENLARVAKEQGAITERVSHDFQTRIDAARAVAERLRLARHQVADRTGGVPAPGESAGGTVEAPGDGFPLARRLLAQEQAIQLDELITWVEAQSELATTPQPGGP